MWMPQARRARSLKRSKTLGSQSLAGEHGKPKLETLGPLGLWAGIIAAACESLGAWLVLQFASVCTAFPGVQP